MLTRKHKPQEADDLSATHRPSAILFSAAACATLRSASFLLSFLLFLLPGYLSSSARGQGTVLFDNRVLTQGIDAPIFYAEQNACSGPAGARIDGASHPTAFAGLYAGPDGSAEENLVLISPVVGFRTGTTAGYVRYVYTQVPSVLPGSVAILQVRAWDACNAAIQSYEDAIQQPGALVGKSNLLRLVTGGAGSPPGPAVALVGLDSFGLYAVPEPSSLALAFVAGVCVWACRGKRRV